MKVSWEGETGLEGPSGLGREKCERDRKGKSGNELIPTELGARRNKRIALLKFALYLLKRQQI